MRGCESWRPWHSPAHSKHQQRCVGRQQPGPGPPLRQHSRSTLPRGTAAAHMQHHCLRVMYRSVDLLPHSMHSMRGAQHAAVGGLVCSPPRLMHQRCSHAVAGGVAVWHPGALPLNMPTAWSSRPALSMAARTVRVQREGGVWQRISRLGSSAGVPPAPLLPPLPAAAHTVQPTVRAVSLMLHGDTLLAATAGAEAQAEARRPGGLPPGRPLRPRTIIPRLAGARVRGVMRHARGPEWGAAGMRMHGEPEGGPVWRGCRGREERVEGIVEALADEIGRAHV